MRFLSKSKKGEMTTQQIVVLIILIASFAVILFFLLRLDLGQKSEDQICHNSVITRGGAGAIADAYPLNCKRSYVCITADGSCEDMVDPIKEKVKTEDDVYQILADELANCWWMFGEGQVNYVGSELFPGLHCSICSQIAFDNSIIDDKNIFGQETFFPRKDLYDYLEKTNYSEEQSYLYYLKAVNKVGDIVSQDFGKINLSKQQYIYMGSVADLNSVGWVASAAAIVGVGVVSVLTTPFSVPALIVGTAAAGTFGYTEFQGGYVSSIYQGSESKFVRPDIIEANSEKWKKLDCDVIDTFN